MVHTLFPLLIFLYLSTNAAWPQSNDSAANLHLLNRATMGPTWQELTLLKDIGREAYIQQQLNPQTIPESYKVTSFIDKSDALHLSPAQLFRKYGPPAIAELARKNMAGSLQNYNSQGFNNTGRHASDEDKLRLQQELLKARQTLYQYVGKQVTTARLLRAINSPRQLQEVMTDFWFNHFNITIKKGFDRIWIGSYEEQAIRPYVLGKFRDLLEATSHHPAMLFYLDNWENTAPNSPGNRGQFKGLNENYARELMELHTLGVDGGYTQKDVIELARILTGLGLPPQPRQSRNSNEQLSKYGSYFDHKRHDFGEKIFLGNKFKGSGADEIEHALDILASNKATAHHICYELTQYFVSDSPPETLVTKLAAKFTNTGGDIRAVMNELLHSNEFWDSHNYGTKYKNPYRYAISAIRISNSQIQNFKPILTFLQTQGMQLYACLTPDGYKCTQSTWLNSDSLLNRINFATKLASGKISQENQPADFNTIRNTLSGIGISPKTSAAIDNAPQPMKAALMLGSPEFMRY